MLAVVGDRFPQTGAVAMSIMGGIGMLSAGLLGGPGLGYAKDRFAGRGAAEDQAPLFMRQYKAAKPSKFLYIESPSLGLDGKKLAEAQEASRRSTPDQQDRR